MKKNISFSWDLWILWWGCAFFMSFKWLFQVLITGDSGVAAIWNSVDLLPSPSFKHLLEHDGHCHFFKNRNGLEYVIESNETTWKNNTNHYKSKITIPHLSHPPNKQTTSFLVHNMFFLNLASIWSSKSTSPPDLPFMRSWWHACKSIVVPLLGGTATITSSTCGWKPCCRKSWDVVKVWMWRWTGHNFTRISNLHGIVRRHWPPPKGFVLRFRNDYL